MQSSIDIYIFIDALGWQIIKNNGFLEEEFPFRKPVKMQFGYSSTAIPTILTGKPPTVHKHLSFYYYTQGRGSPFRFLGYTGLQFLPEKITGNWRFRHNLSKLIKKIYGFTGYFELYSMPFDRLKYFDYIEKKDIFLQGGLAPVPSIADILEGMKIPCHISDWRLTEEENIASLLSELEKKEIRFSFLYTASMDSLLHRVTKDGIELKPKLDWYARQIRMIIAKARANYKNASFHIISDHGMTTLLDVADVKKTVESLHLEFGKDYVGTYDSTMARFYYLNNRAREIIVPALCSVPHSHILSDEEKKRFMIDFNDNMYGETILLMDPGVQIVPSDMGLKALPGMHGYTPEHEDSDASFLSSEPIDCKMEWVGDFFDKMVMSIKKVNSRCSCEGEG